MASAGPGLIHQDNEDADKPYHHERQAPPNKEVKSRYDRSRENGTQGCSGIEDALGEGTFRRREPLGICLRGAGPVPRFTQAEEGSDKAETKKAAGKTMQSARNGRITIVMTIRPSDRRPSRYTCPMAAQPECRDDENQLLFCRPRSPEMSTSRSANCGRCS
jgi:hypothetical protein